MPLSRSNLNDQVATYLRDQILSGHLKPEQKIPQDTVAAELEVSKLPVREALIRLEAEGLVVSIPRRGAYVAAITPDDVLDQYTVYGLVSAYAAQRAAERITDEDLHALESWAEQMERLDGTAEQEELNSLFHGTINRLGGSRRLRSILRGLSNNLPTNFFGVRWHWSAHAHEHHQLILKALRTRDGQLAFEMMYNHLRTSGEHAVQMLQEAGFWNDAATAGKAPAGDPDRSS
jgi:DNA-binding GntR family transcriptional regulator